MFKALRQLVSPATSAERSARNAELQSRAERRFALLLHPAAGVFAQMAVGWTLFGWGLVLMGTVEDPAVYLAFVEDGHYLGADPALSMRVWSLIVSALGAWNIVCALFACDDQRALALLACFFILLRFSEAFWPHTATGTTTYGVLATCCLFAIVSIWITEAEDY